MAKTHPVIALAFAVAAIGGTPPALAAAGGGGGSFSSSDPAPYDPAPDYQKGAAAYEAGNFKVAISLLRRVTSNAPTFAPAQYLLGSSYFRSGDAKGARRPLEKAVRLDDTILEAHRDLAIVAFQLGDSAAAGAQRVALAAMKAKCAMICSTAAQIDAALAAVDAALAGKPQALAPRRMGPPQQAERAYVEAVSLINEHRYEAAIASLEAAVWAAGPDPDLLTYLGFANRKLRRYETARGWYEAALAINPGHRGALEYYGELKLETGDVAGARRHLARLDALCAFGCQQADELRRWLRGEARSAS